MSKYIYDLPMTDWALNFAYQADIENELDNHQITMTALRRQFNINGVIKRYIIKTSNLGRKYVTLYVEMTLPNKEKRLQQFRFYSPFIPQKLKNLSEIVGKRIESISPLCTIRHRRSQSPIVILTSARIKTKDGIVIIRTSTEDDQSRLVLTSENACGQLTDAQKQLEGLTEKEMLRFWYRDPDGFNAVIDPIIAKKLDIKQNS